MRVKEGFLGFCSWCFFEEGGVSLAMGEVEGLRLGGLVVLEVGFVVGESEAEEEEEEEVEEEEDESGELAGRGISAGAGIVGMATRVTLESEEGLETVGWAFLGLGTV